MNLNHLKSSSLKRALLGSFILAFLALVPSLKSDPQGLIIPSYFYPGAPWVKSIANAADGVGGLIVNPSSGPGKVVDKNYAAAVKSAKEAGIKVFGYVYTKYGARPASEVVSDIQKHLNFYNVDGIFFDEVATSTEMLPYYQSLANVVHALPTLIVALNPGTHPAEAYMNVGDIILTFEGTYSKYTKLKVPAWTANYPATRFWHVIHTASQPQMKDAVQLSKARNAGFVYVTDDILANPYDTIPTYLSRELAAVTAP